MHNWFPGRRARRVLAGADRAGRHHRTVPAAAELFRGLVSPSCRTPSSRAAYRAACKSPPWYPVGPAAAAGIEPGDVFLQVAADSARTVTDVLRVLRSLPQGVPAVVRVSRRGQSMDLRYVPREWPRETSPSFDIEYRAVSTSSGAPARDRDPPTRYGPPPGRGALGRHRLLCR